MQDDDLTMETQNDFSIWKNEDPRYSINKRANIIILRPSHNGNYECSMAHVETKNGWDIWASFKDCRSIDDWDKDWLWVLVPDRKI